MQVRASHILVESEDKALGLLDIIKKGADFGQLAQQFSKCPSGQNKGDLGVFGRGQMVPVFETAAFNSRIGQVIGPVQTQFGYHLIKRTE